MAVLSLFTPVPTDVPAEVPSGRWRPELTLVEGSGDEHCAVPDVLPGSEVGPSLVLVEPDRPLSPTRVPHRRRVSPAVRRRRTLLAVTAVLMVALALPVGGTGGRSHATGSALSGAGTVAYTVRPGDTLWAIATRIDPSADPRPMVAKMAAETGSSTVYPGERIRLP